MNDKEITNAELLESMNKGFSNIEKRFSGIEESNQEILESIIRSFSKIEDKMADKEDILRIETRIQDIHTDLNSFKKDTDNSLNNHTIDIEDINKTALFQDKRIAELEDKVFA